MKNTKTVLGIIAFIVTFIFSATLVQTFFPSPFVPVAFERPQVRTGMSSKIEAFIRRDVRNGQIRMESVYNEFGTDDESYTSKYADGVMSYWNTSSKMDADSFPQDFHIAWDKHMQAWGDYAEFLAENKDASASELKSEEFTTAENRYNTEINRTWAKVLRIGRTYGAEVY